MPEQTWKQVADRIYIYSVRFPYTHTHTYTHTPPEVRYTRPDGYSLGSIAPALWQLIFKKRTRYCSWCPHSACKTVSPERVQRRRIQCIKTMRGFSVSQTNKQQESFVISSACGVFTGAIREILLFGNISNSSCELFFCTSL